MRLIYHADMGKYFEIRTTDDSTMSVQLSDTRLLAKNHVVEESEELVFMIQDNIPYGEEMELYASITKIEARKLALLLMNLAKE